MSTNKEDKAMFVPYQLKDKAKKWIGFISVMLQYTIETW